MPDLSPIALQLFSVREELQHDFEGTIERVAEFGYVGVEPFGLTPATAGAARDTLARHGLAVPSIHVAVPVGEKQDEVFAIASTEWLIVELDRCATDTLCLDM